MKLVALLCCVFVVSVADAQEFPLEPHRLAVVIGVNRPVDGYDLAPLRFADEDAARMTEIMRSAQTDVTLLTHPDADAQAWFSWITVEQRAHRVHEPTRTEVLRALHGMLEKARTLLEAGAHVELYFYFSGHGRFDASKAQGELVLADDTFSRSDLYQHLIRALSERDYPGKYRIHVVLDACYAFNVTSSKGAAALLARAAQGAVAERAADYTYLGFIEPVRGTGSVDESPALQGGVFTRELSSGLLGMADVDGDGAVSYAEVAAFITTANSGYNEAKAPADQLRLAFQAPQGNSSLPLFAWPRASSYARLQLGEQLTGRMWLLDARGVRWLDANVGASEAPRAMIAANRDYTLVLPDVGRAYQLRARAGDVLTQDDVETVEMPRGKGQDDALGELWHDAFGRDKFRVLQLPGADSAGFFGAGRETRDTSPDFWSQWWFWSIVGGVAVAGAIAAIVASEPASVDCPAHVDCR